jgi:ribosome-associated protein
MDQQKLLSELTFKAVRSGGAGGQHVNKVSSKVILTFDLQASSALDDDQKAWLMQKLSARLNRENKIVIKCDEDRSQLRNKEIAIKRLLELLSTGLIVPKTRKKSKVPKAAIRKRLESKKLHSEVKQMRRKPEA